MAKAPPGPSLSEPARGNDLGFSLRETVFDGGDDVFGNGVNFQGFPDIPGDDFLTAYPATGGRHDGGSRR